MDSESYMVSFGLMMGGLAGSEIESSVELARRAEELGFESVWMGEGRLMGNIVPHMTMVLHGTSRIRVGSGVLPYRTRNVSLLAATFKTLDEMAPGRVLMGLGAWWEPLASRVGLANRKPLRAMREVITVSRELLAGRTVSFHGEFVDVTDIRFDGLHDDDRRAYDVPIYIGAVRFGMVSLAGEIADGVLLDFLVPPSYTKRALAAVAEGAERSKRPLERFGVPQLVACTVDDDDPQSAVDECKFFLAQYLAQQSHITEFSGADPELVARIKQVVGWPTTRASVMEAAKLVPSSLVRSVSACGTTAQVLDKIEEYVAAGITEAVLCPRGSNEIETVRRIAHRAGHLDRAFGG